MLWYTRFMLIIRVPLGNMSEIVQDREEIYPASQIDLDHELWESIKHQSMLVLGTWYTFMSWAWSRQ